MERLAAEFWMRHLEEIEAMVDFRDRMLPLARLKKIMHAEEHGMMISADTPAFLTKLCELFIQEFAMRAWACADSHHRKIILDADIAEAVAATESYDFLASVLLRFVATQGGSTPTPSPARLGTARKRNRPNGYLDAKPENVHYLSFPFPSLGQVQGEHHPPMVNGMMPLGGFVFFVNSSNDSNDHAFASDNSAAAITTAPSAGALVPAASCYPFPVATKVEPFAVDDTDLCVIQPAFLEVNTGNSGKNVDGAIGVADGQQQQKKENDNDDHCESEVVQQICDVKAPTIVLYAGGTGNKASSLCMNLEEFMIELCPEVDGIFPLASVPSEQEGLVTDQDFLENIFSNPSNSGSSTTN